MAESAKTMATMVNGTTKEGKRTATEESSTTTAQSP